MSTLNDHLRNLIDELPGVQARDFMKAWNREQRALCQERRWRDLRTQYEFTIGTSTAYSVDSSALPYSTGHLAGTVDTNTLTASGETWTTNWAGLNGLQVAVAIPGQAGQHIYDVTGLSTVAHALTVTPALLTTYSTSTYNLFYVPNARMPTDMMGVRWLALIASDRTETVYKQPEDYVMDRVVNGSPLVELRDPNASGTFVLHYYKAPRAMTTMAQTIELPTYVQDVVYLRLLTRYIARTPMDIQTKNFIYGDAKNRLESSLRQAKSYDETQEHHTGVNQSTLWIPDRFNTAQ